MSSYLRLIQALGLTRHPGGLSLTDKLLKRVGLTKQSKVLDLGCGTGHTAFHMAKNYGCSVTAVDVSPEVIKKAKILYGHDSVYEKINFVVDDILHLKLKPASFDLVIVESVLLFIKDKHKALSKIEKLIRPQGYVALIELCHTTDLDAKATMDFFAKEEIKGYLPKSSLYAEHFKNFRTEIFDEQPLSFMSELKADLDLWGNFTGLMLMLESGFSIALNEDLRKDFFSLIAIAKYLPRHILKHLLVLTLLMQKN